MMNDYVFTKTHVVLDRKTKISKERFIEMVNHLDTKASKNLEKKWLDRVTISGIQLNGQGRKELEHFAKILGIGFNSSWTDNTLRKNIAKHF